MGKRRVVDRKKRKRLRPHGAICPSPKLWSLYQQSLESEVNSICGVPSEEPLLTPSQVDDLSKHLAMCSSCWEEAPQFGLDEIALPAVKKRYHSYKNPDERMRDLERRAALGDQEALAQLRAMQARVPDACLVCGAGTQLSRSPDETGWLCQEHSRLSRHWRNKLARAVEADHPCEDDNACDIAAALRAGFEEVAADQLLNATECESLERLLERMGRKGIVLHAPGESRPLGWLEWVDWFHQHTVECPECNAFVFTDEYGQPDHCSNCHAAIPEEEEEEEDDQFEDLDEPLDNPDEQQRLRWNPWVTGSDGFPEFQQAYVDLFTADGIPYWRAQLDEGRLAAIDDESPLAQSSAEVEQSLRSLLGLQLQAGLAGYPGMPRPSPGDTAHFTIGDRRWVENL